MSRILSQSSWSPFLTTVPGGTARSTTRLLQTLVSSDTGVMRAASKTPFRSISIFSRLGSTANVSGAGVVSGWAAGVAAGWASSGPGWGTTSRGGRSAVAGETISTNMATKTKQHVLRMVVPFETKVVTTVHYHDTIAASTC